MPRKCGVFMNYQHHDAYPCTRIRALSQLLASESIITLDVVIRSDRDKRPVARLFKKGAGGLRLPMEAYDREAHAMLKWFMQFHVREKRYGTVYNGYTGLAGYLAARDHLEVSPVIENNDSRITIVAAMLHLACEITRLVPPLQ